MPVSVKPLSTPPVPANQYEPYRALFVWNEDDDFLCRVGGDGWTGQQDIIDLCGARNLNQVFLGFYSKIGGLNWSEEGVGHLSTFISACHASGIGVFALAGGPNWGIFQEWVKKNIVRPISQYNAIAGPSGQFDGLLYDVEPWTDGNLNLVDNIRGICHLLDNTRVYLQKPAGFFAAPFLCQTGHPLAAPFSFRGASLKPGEHLMNAGDFGVIGCYSDHALDDGTNPGQYDFLKPWHDYARSQSRGGITLYCASETGNPAGLQDWETYYGESLAAMNAQLDATTNKLASHRTSCWAGHAIHYFNKYREMQ